MKTYTVLAILFTTYMSVHSQPVSHDIFDGLLKKHVNAQGNVNYDGFKKDQKTFDTYLDILSKNEPSASWSTSEQLAYWINVYNAFTISKKVVGYE